MDRKWVLELPNEELYNGFMEEVLTDAIGSERLVTELEGSERYSSDFIFRIHIQTARQFIHASIQKFDEVLDKANDLVIRSTVLELPELLNLNYHILGICYKLMGHFEQALECFFNVLKGERKLSIKRLSSIVNFYIGEIYLVHDDKETAMKYINIAFDILEKTKDREPRYVSKKICYTHILIQLLYDEKKYQEMYHCVEDLNSYSENKTPIESYTYNWSQIYCHLAKEDFEAARTAFHKILNDCGNEMEYKLQQLAIYLKLLFEYDLDPRFYETELFLYLDSPEPRYNYINYLLNKYLYEYYTKTGNHKAALDRILKSYHSIEQEMNDLIEKKVSSFKIIEKNSMMEEDISTIMEKNHELKLMADEALKNKELAEKTLQRLSLVSELGKKLTHSLDMKGIISTVYEKLKVNLPLESFIIMIKNDAENQLESIVFYEYDRLQEQLILDQNDKNSVFVETFNSKKHIKINDFFEDVRFETQQAKYESEIFRSVIFLPLSIENEVLGVCSLQHSEPHIYTEEHIAFLEELLPYLSIALNNALKSEALEKEIGERKRTQSKLEEVNRKLEVLSCLDGLTQISNRRDFENRFMHFLLKSKMDEEPLSLFMFDIDNFKLYNDNYGHLEGDEALKAVAMIVQRNFEKVGGLSARFGGEEFIAACLNLSDRQSQALGETIRKEVFELGLEHRKNPQGRLTISVGIAHAEGLDDIKKYAIMRWADIALYTAKRTGKNRVVLKNIQPEEEPPEGLRELEF